MLPGKRGGVEKSRKRFRSPRRGGEKQNREKEIRGKGADALWDRSAKAKGENAGGQRGSAEFRGRDLRTGPAKEHSWKTSFPEDLRFRRFAWKRKRGTLLKNIELERKDLNPR